MIKGQAGIEFVTIVAIGLMLLIPISLMFQSYTSQTTNDVVDQQIVMIGSNMLSKAEEMYGLGSNSFTTLEVRLPEEVLSVKIANSSELYFTYDSPSGPSDIVFFSDRVEITNGTFAACQNECEIDLSPGQNRLLIRSRGPNVEMNVRNN